MEDEDKHHRSRSKSKSKSRKNSKSGSKSRENSKSRSKSRSKSPGTHKEKRKSKKDNDAGGFRETARPLIYTGHGQTSQIGSANLDEMKRDVEFLNRRRACNARICVVQCDATKDKFKQRMHMRQQQQNNNNNDNNNIGLNRHPRCMFIVAAWPPGVSLRRCTVPIDQCPVENFISGVCFGCIDYIGYARSPCGQVLDF